MGFSGLSSLDLLISLLLIETGWWGKAFLENTFHYLFDGAIDILTAAYVLVVLLKFLCQGIAWYAFLCNPGGRLSQGLLLKTWFCISTGLDLVMISWIVGVNAISGGYCAVLPRISYSVLVLSWVWVIGFRLVFDISTQDDKGLFPSGFTAYVTDRSRIQATLTIMVIGELIFYALSLVGTILSKFYAWSILLPYDEQPGSWLMCLLLSKPVVVALFQLIGIRQGWKGFLKCWFSVYILFNVLGYILTNSEKLYRNFQWNDSAASWVTFGGQLTLSLCALVIKFGIVVASFVFLFRAGETPEPEDTDEEKPLISPNPNENECIQ